MNPFVASQKLSQLAETANANHRAVGRVWLQALNYAKVAGDALNEARPILGGRGRWGKWVRSQFDGSWRTARVYMRVSKKWNDPRMETARAGGMEPESIQAFLDIVRGKSPRRTILTARSQKERREIGRESDIRDLQRQFSMMLRGLHPTELRALREICFAPHWPLFTDWGDRSIWGVVYRLLKDRVIVTIDEEFYPEEVEANRQLHKEIAERERRAINRRFDESRALVPGFSTEQAP
jgi:hypothetical protein